MKHKFLNLEIDFKSLKFKLWAYFALFAIAILVLLWFLQVFFVNYYYQEMKISETNRLSQTIVDQLGKDNFVERLQDISSTNDLYIHVERNDGAILYSPILNYDASMPPYTYFHELQLVREQFFKSESKTLSVIIEDDGSQYNTLGYACSKNLDNGLVVNFFILSPLYPVESTITILKNQLIYVTIISLILAFAMGIYLSNRVSKPLRDITASAMQLAKGKYGIVFRGSHYSEITNLADTLTYTSIELEKSVSQQKDMMANVSHDLKTPLTMVKSYAEMIRDISGDNPTKRNSHLQVIIDEADRLNLLVNDMLTLSRMQTGAVVLEKARFSIKEAIESIINAFEILSVQEGYQIEFVCPHDLFVVADENRIKQVLSNLITNAIKYCGDDKRIIVNVRKSKGKMLCEITDHGMGIAKEELDRIWDRYYKASTNHVRTTNGTGLGLSIVKEILLLHNADFGVVSELGKGSTFWFSLDL